MTPNLLASIDFSYKRELANVFKRVARSHPGKEVYAVMLGHRNGSRVCFTDLWWPEDGPACANHLRTEDVFTKPNWLNEAQAIADSEGLELIGDIHSHAYPNQSTHIFDRAPSETDWLRSSPFWIRGICVVSTCDGRRRVSLKFWPDLRPMRVHGI